MSHQLKFATSITNHKVLKRACDRMREAGIAAIGPREHEERRLSAAMGGGTRKAWTVGLPGWRNEAEFYCDPTGMMVADNFSPYFDERQIDPATGERIPNSGRVHADVLSGKKRVGDDGRWGDIAYLDRLQMEYRVALMETALPEIGGSIISTEVNEAEGLMVVMIETP